MKALNFKRLSIIFTVCFVLLLIFAFYKILQFDLFPWLNVFILSTLSFCSFLISFLVKKKSKIIQFSVFALLISQLIYNYFLLNDADLLMQSWRRLIYPLSILVYFLSFAMIQKKQGKLKVLSLISLTFSIVAFIANIFQTAEFWVVFQAITYILFILGVLFYKNSPKEKSPNYKTN